MTNNPIHTGVLSYGMSGRVFHTPFIEANEHFVLSAVVERSTKQAHLKYPNIMSYDSVEELLNVEEIELIVVNTPNDTHVEYAKKALLAGKNVLIEKPFAPTPSEAQTLFDLAKKVGKFILPYHNRRYDSDFLSLKKILDTQVLGTPIELHLRFDRYRPTIGSKVFKETVRPACGVLYDLGSHLLDQALSLFGKPTEIVKVKNIHRANSVVDDYASLILIYQNGLTVFITTSLLVADPQASFVLHGTKGSFVKKRSDVQENQLLSDYSPIDPQYAIEHPDDAGILTLVDADGKINQKIEPAPAGNYMKVYDEVYQSIRQGKTYFVHPEQIITQLEIIANEL